MAFAAVLLLAAVGMSLPAELARAQKADYDHVINLAGKQRMIVQQIGKETVLLAMGIEKDKRLERIRSLHALFERTLNGLRNGDEELRLPGTENPEILDDISRVGELWSLHSSALQDVLNKGQLSPANVAIVADLSTPLLEAADKTVQDYKKEANGIGLFSVLAVAIDISDRQRMLSQKMAKEYLLIAFGHESEKNRQELRQTIEVFDSSLTWLLDGNAEMQLLPAPTPEIRTQLRRVQERWDEFRPMMNGALEGAEITPDLVERVSGTSMFLLEEANAVVELYEAL